MISGMNQADIARLSALVGPYPRPGLTQLLIAAATGRIERLECSMPECLCPSGRGHFDQAGSGPWAPSSDRYPSPARLGGAYEPDNIRLSHAYCNKIEGSRVGGRSVKPPRPSYRVPEGAMSATDFDRRWRKATSPVEVVAWGRVIGRWVPEARLASEAHVDPAPTGVAGGPGPASPAGPGSPVAGTAADGVPPLYPRPVPKPSTVRPAKTRGRALRP